MADVTYKMFGTQSGGATGNSVASVDIQDDGMIEGVYLAVVGLSGDVLGDVSRAEISFGSTNAFDQNDARISILEVYLRQSFLTSGGGPMHGWVYVPVELKVNAGERIHMHMEASAGNDSEAVAYLYCSGRSASSRRARRRR